MRSAIYARSSSDLPGKASRRQSAVMKHLTGGQMEPDAAFWIKWRARINRARLVAAPARLSVWRATPNARAVQQRRLPRLTPGTIPPIHPIPAQDLTRSEAHDPIVIGPSASLSQLQHNLSHDLNRLPT